MQIDFSKLSPTQRDRILKAVDNAALAEYNNIKDDLEKWTNPESPTYKEMEGWMNACLEIHVQSRDIRRQVKENN